MKMKTIKNTDKRNSAAKLVCAALNHGGVGRWQALESALHAISALENDSEMQFSQWDRMISNLPAIVEKN